MIEILIDKKENEKEIALVENGNLIEYYIDENESTIELKEDDLLLVIGIEEDALSKQSSRYLRKLLRSQGRKLLISTQMIDQKMLNYFHETLLLPIDHLEMKERRIMFHCLIDMMMSRYHECA